MLATYLVYTYSIMLFRQLHTQECKREEDPLLLIVVNLLYITFSAIGAYHNLNVFMAEFVPQNHVDYHMSQYSILDTHKDFFFFLVHCMDSWCPCSVVVIRK